MLDFTGLVLWTLYGLMWSPGPLKEDDNQNEWEESTAW
jgi:hypothetical protein